MSVFKNYMQPAAAYMPEEREAGMQSPSPAEVIAARVWWSLPVNAGAQKTHAVLSLPTRDFFR